MRKIFKRIYTKIYIFFSDLFFSRFRKSSYSQRSGVLIVYGGVIGDSVIFCDALRGFKELFPPEEYDITIVCPTSAATVFKNYVSRILVKPVDFKRLNTDTKYHKTVMDDICKMQYEYAINPFFAQSNESDSIMANCRAKKKVQAALDIHHKLKLNEYIINNLAGRKIVVSKELMEIQRTSEFLKQIGVHNYKSRTSELPCTTNIDALNLPDRFCLIALGASTPCKRWPANRFAEVANFVFHELGLSIVLCGSEDEMFLVDDFCSSLDSDVSPYDLVGRTSIPQLVEVIRHAEFLVGNDSSSGHIAVAVKTQAFCVEGGWDYGRMFPYVVEEVSNEDHLLIPIYKQMSCFNCSDVFVGANNSECKKCIERIENYPCISNISSDDVICAIRDFYRKKDYI